MSPTTAADHPGRIFADASAYADFDGWHAAAVRLRRQSPVLRVELADRTPFWALTRHADVMEVERNPDLFTNSPGPTLNPRRPDPDTADPPVVRTLIQMDGDDHRIHRGLISEWFKPGRVRLLTDTVDALAERSVREMAALGGECDFAQQIAAHFPLRVILSILGLPEDDYPRMLRLTQELFGADDPDFERIATDDQAISVIMDFIGYFAGLTADRRAHPTDDLASVVANAVLDGSPLGDLETFGYYLITATAGHDTTSSAIAGGMLALLQHPEQLAWLRDDPARVDHAVDEIVRWVSPVKHFMRTARADTEIRGTSIARGDWVLLSYQSANRDEDVFADPFRFDLARTDADRSLGFGFGRHYCLGAHLAKLEIRSFFKALLPRLASIELAGEPRLVHSHLVSGPKFLPVRYVMR